MWDKNDWLYEGQHGFRPEYSCESQVITVCQDTADSLDNGDKIDAIIVDFSKAFVSVPHGRLLTKITNSGLDYRVVGWIREFVLGHTQRVRVGEQLSEKVRVNSRVHSDEQKSIGMIYRTSRSVSDVRYSCHHNSSRFSYPIFVHSSGLSVFHSLQSIIPPYILTENKNTIA